jgi:hypothetical protein
MNGRIAGSLVGAAVLALVLSGCVQAAPAVPAPTRPAVATASPTPTPVVTVQPLRVPATCDQLMPAAALAQIGSGLATVERERTTSVTSWMDTRVGSLECSWSNGATGADGLRLVVAVAPDVTREGFDGFLDGEQGAGIHHPAVAPDAYTLRIDDKPIGFMFLTQHYGASGHLAAGANVRLPADSDSTMLAQIHGVVSALGAPGPLWKPTPTLRGATECEGLATAAQLGDLSGLPAAREIKGDRGEYSASLYDTDRQVGGYWCTWGADDQTVTGMVTVGVLPGGASYAAEARPAGSVDVPGLGQSAYRQPDGTLDVTADGGWVQVRVDGGITADQQSALADQVLVNVGYGG